MGRGMTARKHQDEADFQPILAETKAIFRGLRLYRLTGGEVAPGEGGGKREAA